MSPVPDNIQNATRVAVCVLVSCVLGYGVVLPWYGEPHPGDTVIQYAQACKWAAITSVVIAQPVIGKLSQVGVERVFGTILGGTFGFAAFRFGQQFWTTTYSQRDDGVVLSLLAFTAAFFGVWAGSKLKLDYSAKLFTMTFLLVTFGATQDHSGLLIMVTRISGICGGVLLSLLASIVIFPRSASQEAIRHTAKALQALTELSSQVWSEGVRNNLTEGGGANGSSERPAPAAIPYTASRLVEGLTGGHNPSGDGGSPSKAEELCEDKLMVMYNALTKAADFVAQSKGEIYLGSWCSNHAVFLPGLPWWPTGRWQLPAAEFSDLAASMKAAARLLFALHLAFDEGFDDDLIAMLRQQYPGALLPHLGAAAHGCLADAVEAFPRRPFVSPAHLHRFHQAVEGLLAISDFRRRQIYQRLRPGGLRAMTRNRTMRTRRDGTPSSSGPGTLAGTHKSTLAYSTGRRSMNASAAASLATSNGSPPDRPPANGSVPAPAPSAAPSGGGAVAALHHISDRRGGPATASGETLKEMQQEHPMRSPFEAFAGLPDDLRINVFTPPSSPPLGAAPGGRSAASMRVEDGLEARMHLSVPRVPSSELLVFPDTGQGYVNSVRWASFQFLVAEIAEELQELHKVLSDLLERMPNPNPFHS
mmetsp:Transcript_8270/g.24700  ORF Transcript_8270/g.24700 Transcript_8270/m.24700 type:complete len:646 (-) Transcript_8270:2468-4405(-)|eukprot:CAMPEP_0206136028 /NCGR_PEP_ID=MMETSP1473-20131121/1263_1 /ASSEMBLY_ACC=CAM_ASM_001109 /TAXON_ID=1461547 /ORGANISM="Stichococcus sp, Strain RCC1054" /LENGTH=645 /DNA_ID=CAMNT_0053528245 /DNA_START=426 /DNA_END=2363 /DNA_ORIENTATION=+